MPSSYRNTGTLCDLGPLFFDNHAYLKGDRRPQAPAVDKCGDSVHKDFGRLRVQVKPGMDLDSSVK